MKSNPRLQFGKPAPPINRSARRIFYVSVLIAIFSGLYAIRAFFLP